MNEDKALMNASATASASFNLTLLLFQMLDRKGVLPLHEAAEFLDDQIPILEGIDEDALDRLRSVAHALRGRIL